MGTVHNLAIAKAHTSDQRVAPRRRVLMGATLRVRGKAARYQVTVKDISSTGLKAATGVSIFAGAAVEIELPNLGWVPGEVVRREDERCIGVRFDVVIAPEMTQKSVTGSYGPGPSPASTPSLRRI